MFRNYVVIALRNIIRNKIFTIVNISGLSLGMAFSLFIYLWINDELSINKFHASGDRLFRVLQSQTYDGGKITVRDETPGLLAETLKNEIAEIENAVTLTSNESIPFKKDEMLSRENGFYASEDFFKIFSFPMQYGDLITCLSSSENIVVSKKIAVKYFGNANPIGKWIHVEDRKDFMITGVFENVPSESTLQFDFIIAYKDYEMNAPWAKDWGAIGNKTFIKLNKNASAEEVNEKIKSLLETKAKENTDKLSLQSFSEMYLYSNFTNGKVDGGPIDNVKIFSLVALGVLIMACINFMNLATAQASRRIKEVGIRKVIGANRKLLIAQFIGEAVLICLLAGVLSMILTQLLLPSFNDLTGKKIESSFYNLNFLVTFFSITSLTGILSGLYPALIISSLKPANILKGTWKLNSSAIFLKKGLVIFQFSLSLIFIIGAIVVHQQLEYIQHKNLGFEREHMLYQFLEGDMKKNFEPFRNELMQSQAIESVTSSNQPPLEINYPSTWVEWPGKNKQNDLRFTFAGIGYDYLKTMNIDLKDGRDFSKDFKSDTANVIINEEAAKQMGILDPLGHEINTKRDISRKGKIIGVVKDFHLTSMHKPIEPLYLFLDNNMGFGYIIIKTKAGKVKEALAILTKMNKKYNPEYPVTFTFAQDVFNKQYKNEQVVAKLSNVFMSLSIFISSLGLFGLVAFTVGQRTKEIGVRKVLGATVFSITKLISIDFIKFIFYAIVVATPLSWILMSEWLGHFAYKIELQIILFILAAISIILLSIIIIGVESMKAAFANPVDALRNE